MFTEGKPEGNREKPQDTQSSGVQLSAAAYKKQNKKQTKKNC